MPNIKFNDLQINQSIEAEAPDSSLVITPDPRAGIRPGTYLFQLEVIDDAGNRSTPAQARVTVLDDQAPNAIISAPSTVGVGKGFTLSGRESTDVDGQITRYIWTLVR